MRSGVVVVFGARDLLAPSLTGIARMLASDCRNNGAHDFISLQCSVAGVMSVGEMHRSRIRGSTGTIKKDRSRRTNRRKRFPTFPARAGKLKTKQ